MSPVTCELLSSPFTKKVVRTLFDVPGEEIAGQYIMQRHDYFLELGSWLVVQQLHFDLLKDFLGHNQVGLSNVSSMVPLRATGVWSALSGFRVWYMNLPGERSLDL